MYCISSFVACKIASCSESPDIPDSAGRKTKRRRTYAIAKRYAFTQTQKGKLNEDNKINEQ